MNRIDKKFQELQDQGARAFMPYVCAGDPTPELTPKLFRALEEAGADLIELGVPFSDPIADGPTIQRASERALTHNISLQQILEIATSVRQETDIPIALMSYYNPIFRMEKRRFAKLHKLQALTVSSCQTCRQNRQNRSLKSHHAITSPRSFSSRRQVHRNGCS